MAPTATARGLIVHREGSDAEIHLRSVSRSTVISQCRDKTSNFSSVPWVRAVLVNPERETTGFRDSSTTSIQSEATMVLIVCVHAVSNEGLTGGPSGPWWPGKPALPSSP